MYGIYIHTNSVGTEPTIIIFISDFGGHKILSTKNIKEGFYSEILKIQMHLSTHTYIYVYKKSRF